MKGHYIISDKQHICKYYLDFMMQELQRDRWPKEPYICGAMNILKKNHNNTAMGLIAFIHCQGAPSQYKNFASLILTWIPSGKRKTKHKIKMTSWMSGEMTGIAFLDICDGSRGLPPLIEL